MGQRRGAPEPQPRSSPQGAPPFPPARYPRPYPPARRGAAARAPGPRGRRGGGPPGVGSWRAARPWRRRTACTSSGRACAPTRCGWEPRALRAGRTRSARAPGEGGPGPSQPPQQLPGVGARGGGRWAGRSAFPDRFPKCLGALNLTYPRPLLPSSEPMWGVRAPDPGASFTRKRRRR